MESDNKKKEKKFTEEQLAAIKAIKNTVVAAGAGSGKTTVLAKRFVNLIQKHGMHADEILTLTFTKKATVEMSDRIYRELKETVPEEAAIFYKANIKTLDSYCNSVAKLGSRYYGISPDFVQDNDALRQLISEKALPFLLKHRDNIVIKNFVKTQDYEQIAEELFVDPIFRYSTIAEPVNFKKNLEKQFNRVCDEWNSTYRDVISLADRADAFENEYDGDHSKSTFQGYIDFKKEHSLPELNEIRPERLPDVDFQSYMREVTQQLCPFTKYPRLAKLKGVEYFTEIVDLLKEKVTVLISLCNYINGIDFVDKLIPLMEEFQEIVNTVKRTTNCLSFADISNMALCILRDYPEIRRLEKNKYKAIMIDEFQDNNQNQRDMLFLLAEKPERNQKGVPQVEELCPDKLFFVGDEKQSIYRFRGADVEVFNSLSRDFAKGHLYMGTNHRSNPSLIAAFNAIFGGTLNTGTHEYDSIDYAPAVFFTRHTQMRYDVPRYEAVYEDVNIPEYKKDQKSNEKVIHLAVYNDDQDADKDSLVNESAEAEWVARQIDEKIASGVNPSDIAVLIRNYSFLQLFEKTFLRHGIPYNTEAVKGFFSDGPVSDMIAFLKIIAYPEDRIAYAQVLRSPFVNLSIEDAEAILALGDNPFSESGFNLLKEVSLNRYKITKDFYEQLYGERTEGISKIITKLWYDGGYRFETMWNKTVQMYGKLYDLVFELARKADADNESLSSFVDNISIYKNENIKMDEVEIPLEKAEGVHIMSIHKSKGLEFPIVFICNTHQKSAALKNNKKVFFSEDYGIVVNSPFLPEVSNYKLDNNYFFELIREETKLKEAAELRRICYVALTRAIDEIYITNGKFDASPKTDPMDYIPGGETPPQTLYQTLAPIINFYERDEHLKFSPFTEMEFIPPYSFKESTVNKGRLNTRSEKLRFIEKLKNSNIYDSAKVFEKDPEPVKYISPSKLHSEDDETRSEIGEKIEENKAIPFSEINEIVNKYSPAFNFNNFGTIAHAYMEAIINGTKPQFSNREITGLESNSKALETIEKICSIMQKEFVKSSLGKNAVNSKWHKAEYAFRCRIAGKIINGTIDLVFENDDGTFTIVDYKTNQQIEPEIYFTQLACYRHAVAAMMKIPAEKIRCYLYYLRFGKEVDITNECSKVDIEQAVKTLSDQL